jgi:hypothetical protein
VAPTGLRRAAALCAGLALVATTAACGADRRLEPGGADSGDCVERPCASFAYAYGKARGGDVIEVGKGVYPEQTVPYGNKTVTFRGARGAVVRRLENRASNITFDGIDVDAGGVKPRSAAFENNGERGGRNVTFRNGRIGNVVDQKGVLLGGPGKAAVPMNVVFDNVEFHDVLFRTEGVHNECVFSEAPGLTIRNSTFRDCATMDLFIVRGDWWGQEPYGDVVLENNVFAHSTNGDGWHHYGLYWSNDAFERVRVVNNTFENAVILDNVGEGPYSGLWANNVGGGWACLPGVEFRNNVGTRCHGSDRGLTPETSCAPPACTPANLMPAGFRDPGRSDLRLTEGSIAVDAGSAAHAPERDRDGVRRDDAPDAGAYELTSGR